MEIISGAPERSEFHYCNNDSSEANAIIAVILRVKRSSQLPELYFKQWYKLIISRESYYKSRIESKDLYLRFMPLAKCLSISLNGYYIV